MGGKMKKKYYLLIAVSTLFFSSFVSSDSHTSCRDTDNGNFYEKGQTIWGKTSQYDKCVQTIRNTPKNRLIEWYCEDGVGKTIRLNCENGCSDGECRGTEPEGGTNSVASMMNQDEGMNNEDLMSDDPIMKNGLGVKSTGDKSLLDSSETCTDSDGGKNYNIQGKIVYLGDKITDSCVKSIRSTPQVRLIEYYCEDGIRKSVRVNCEEGCSNGACNVKTEEQKRTAVKKKKQKTSENYLPCNAICKKEHSDGGTCVRSTMKCRQKGGFVVGTGRNQNCGRKYKICCCNI